MRRTKGDYFLTHGLHPHLQKILVETLQSNFFSLNFDESAVNKTSQLDINVSFINNKKAVKQNLTTLSMEKGTSASEIVDIVFGFLESNLIPLSNIVVVTTDGCSTMLGEENGVQSLMRRRLDHLPHWGGCSCHDLSNLLKAGVAKLNPNLTSLYSQLHSYLSSASLHRLREYQEFCNVKGLETHSIPKFFDVRFRTISACAQWMEKDFRCLYLWFSKLTDEVKNGSHKDINATEEFILQHFSSNIIGVMLCNLFITDVGKPIMDLIDHFESEEPNIFDRFNAITDFLVTFLGRFLVNGGMKEGEEEIRTVDFLKIEFQERRNQLSNRDISLGPSVDSFISEIGLTRSSPELVPFLDQVRAFYCEATQKAMKYFKPALSSKGLQDCDILHPKTFFGVPLDTLKKKFKCLATRFTNIINLAQIPALLDQVTSLRARSEVRERVESLISPVDFFSRLLTWKEGMYRLVGLLGCSLLTVHGSGSTAERDISLMNCVVGDPSRNRTGQQRLQARLSLKSYNLGLKHACKECQEVRDRKLAKSEAKRDALNNNDSDNDDDEEDEITDSRHCHCPKFVVTEAMLGSMSGGQPSQRFKAEAKIRKEQLQIEMVLVTSRQEDAQKVKKEMKTELQRFRRALQKQTLENSRLQVSCIYVKV